MTRQTGSRAGSARTSGANCATVRSNDWMAARAIACAAAVILVACGADDRPVVRTSLELQAILGGADTLHERAVDMREFSFPEDHRSHPSFRTEWWYFTGNLTADDGREFGYQLTFFRSALTDTSTYARTVPAGADTRSDWRTRHGWMAHFAVSDITARRMYAAERFGRAALGLAGAEAEPFRVWLDDWHAGAVTTGTFPLRLNAAAGDVAIDLVLQQGKPIVLQGDGGLSRKGAEPGNASYYYSLTRIPVAGTVRVAGRNHRVRGAGWLDREWSTSVLSPQLEGWDWMALQLDDSTELMLYRLRRHDGSVDPFSAGAYIDADGLHSPLGAADFSMTPRARWRSPIDGTPYPTRWHVTVPALALDLDVQAAFDAQELDLAVRYWEGAVRIAGTRAGAPVAGRGYLEMTGYAAAEPTEPRRWSPR